MAMLGLIPLRIVTVWLFVNAGESVFVAVLLHATSNVSEFPFPNYGSHHDPFTAFIVFTGMAGVIVVLYGPTLSRFRFARPLSR